MIKHRHIGRYNSRTVKGRVVHKRRPIHPLKRVNKAMPLSESQKRKIEEIKDYLEERYPPGSIQQIEKFEVKELPIPDDNPEEVKSFNELVGTNRRVRTGRVLADVRASVDVPAEKRNNPFLHDSYYFLIHPKGKLSHAEHDVFGGDKPIDMKRLFMNRRRRRRE
jgi:hypothetical protein